MPSQTADPRPEDTGTRAHRVEDVLPQPPLPPRTVIVECHGCKGHGKVQMSVHDILMESIDLISTDADRVIVRFYERTFAMDPVMTEIFPPDLTSAPTHSAESRGAQQRDKLVQALVKVAQLYGAGEREEGELDVILRQAGRSHANFWRKSEGRTRAPSPREFAIMKVALVEALQEIFGDRWLPEYTAVWGEAYDYAETEMRHSMQHEGRHMQHPRQARRTAEDAS